MEHVTVTGVGSVLISAPTKLPHEQFSPVRLVRPSPTAVQAERSGQSAPNSAAPYRRADGGEQSDVEYDVDLKVVHVGPNRRLNFPTPY